MSAAILPFRAPERPQPHAVGAADPGAAVAGIVFAGTPPRLATLYHKAPYRVMFPRVEPGDPPLAVVANLSGGIVAGDRLDLSVAVRDGAGATVTTQAAEKVYRSPDSRVARSLVRLRVDRGCRLEWLPLETILFRDARIERRIEVDVDTGGRLSAGEMVVFGRRAHGETFSRGLLDDRWEIRYGGRAVWADAFRLDRPERILDHPAGLGGARAAATFVHVGADASDLLGAAREMGSGEGVRFGATVIGPVLIARWLAERAEALRAAYGGFRAGFRAAAFGFAPALPRMWSL